MTPSGLGSGTVDFGSLSSALWRAREVLDHLLFKIFQTHLVLQAGPNQWLAKTSRELEAALQEVRHVEVLRAAETVALADRLGLSPDVTLGQLTAIAPPPWDLILEEHLDALRRLAAEIDRAAAEPPPVGNAGAPATDREFVADVDVLRKFLVDTLAGAQQASLVAFVA